MGELNFLLYSYIISKDWKETLEDFFKKHHTIFVLKECFDDYMRPAGHELIKFLEDYQGHGFRMDHPFVLLIKAYILLLQAGLRPGEIPVKEDTAKYKVPAEVKEFTDRIQKQMNEIKELTDKKELAEDVYRCSSESDPMLIFMKIVIGENADSFDVSIDPRGSHSDKLLIRCIRDFLQVYANKMRDGIKANTELMIQNTINQIRDDEK